MINLCVFDLDGTLLDTLQDLAASTDYALEKNGFPKRELDEYRYFVCDGLPMLLKRALGNYYTEEASLCLVDDFTYYYSSHYNDYTHPYNGVPELLASLMARNIKIAVLSNKPDNFVKLIVHEMFPKTDFAFIQGKTDKFPRKPDPASLIYILGELNFNPDETLYIGDSNVDVFTGHNAGIKVAGVTWGFREKYELEEAGADFIVELPHSLLEII